MVMTRYETLISLGEDFVKLVGKNLIPVHVLDWKILYEAYLKETEYHTKYFKKVRKTHMIQLVAENYDITERTMFNVVSFMEGE